MRAEAERAYQAQRMAQTIDALKVASLEAAHVTGEALARGAAEHSKEAGIVGSGLGAALRGAGKAVGSVGRLGNTGRLLRAAEQAGVAPDVAGAGLGGALRSAGKSMQQAGVRASMPGKKPLVGLGTKAKLLGGAALLGTGYLAAKGTRTARDYMMVPSSTPVYGHGRPPLAHGVNQYGYPQY